jgi:hypothetical protein
MGHFVYKKSPILTFETFQRESNVSMAANVTKNPPHS